MVWGKSNKTSRERYSAYRTNTAYLSAGSASGSIWLPSRKTELLEAERAKDEIRDILSRMIGAQIRYARLGYWVRASIYGYANLPAFDISCLSKAAAEVYLFTQTLSANKRNRSRKN